MTEYPELVDMISSNEEDEANVDAKNFMYPEVCALDNLIYIAEFFFPFP
jgi:hypothetical protein